MSKSGLKAFVYSFSVSLFAIIAANRAFWHTSPSAPSSLSISDKNITLFLKNNNISRAPVKKIALNTLAEIPSSSPQPLSAQPEVILANAFDEIDFPLEHDLSEQPRQSNVQQLVLADVLYAPEKPLETLKIEAEPVYTPEQSAEPIFKAPEFKHEIKVAVKEDTPKTILQQAPKDTAADTALLSARAATADNFPLQATSDVSKNGNKINIGNPQDLNHVALDNSNIPIHSMEKEIAQTAAPKKENKDWKQLNDNPWIVAKSNGVSRNKMADADFTNKTDEEITRALTPSQNRAGIQIASETVKNLIIPIPGEIMKDENLTPKLAYPSTSEDAEKEKAIDEKLKKQEKVIKTTENKKLLSPIEEDIELDAPEAQSTPITSPITAAPQPTAAAEGKQNSAPEKGGIMNALNSIFSTSQKAVSDAKEKAIAKAQAKRSFRKRLAKNRPVSIMPTEIKLSFQPNRAEISGQTLRWVQAFASKAAEASDIMLEIRIDGTSSANLQQKRLNLLHNILTNKGVEHNKINTVFTTREPNSFILRTINLGNDTKGNNQRKTNNPAQGQYIQW